MSMDTLRFLLFEVQDFADLLEYERYADYDAEAIDVMLSAAKDLADKEYYPTFREMDEQPVRYEDGKIITHPKLGHILSKAAEAGLFGSTFSYEHGGMQLPQMVFGATNHIYQAANNNVVGYVNLTTGAANLIVTFGSQALIDTYVPQMMTGKWMGTMALTEPQAGSSLSDIVTSAQPVEGGAYKIKGQKIFISGGDHPYADNFVHLTLARIEGAPAGTKGISLFVVPKFRPEADGQLVANDVVTAGDFQKMGQKGYATTHLAYGENDDCYGYLVGQPHQGLRYMFQMMNEARIDVGLTAASVASAAYYASLQYASERPQGRRLTSDGKKDIGAEQTLIINHPDVRRMLLFQKAVVEGSLSLLLACGRLSDLHLVETGEAKEEAHLLLELLTPIAKTYPSEMGRMAISNGLQILGGYGFCTDFPLQQYYRDVRIMSLYEGTTGIQSLDLLGRKITMQDGRALKILSKQMMATIAEASTLSELQPYANQLAEKLQLTQDVLQHLLTYAKTGNYERYLADATIFMEFFGTITIAWQWLKIGIIAKRALLTEDTQFGSHFYKSKLLTMRFFFRYELRRTSALADILKDPESLTTLREKELII